MKNIDTIGGFELNYEPKKIANLLNKQKPKKKERNINMENNKKINLETIKTVVIAVFITAIIAFVLGINYQKAKQAEIDAKVEEALTALKNDK